MKLESLTIAQLRDLDEINPDLAFVARRLLAPAAGYEEWVNVLELDLLQCVKFLEEDPLIRRKDGEDRLTADLIGNLRSRAYDASHDEKVGGHADIVVRNPKGYLWLGEAKIHASYDYLLQGFNQLCTRYSRGTPEADRGALIIYTRVADVAAVVERWREYVKAQGITDFEAADCSIRKEHAFRSSHRHKSGGRPYRVWHLGVVLHCEPDDKKQKSGAAAPSVATAAAPAANSSAKLAS